MFAYCNWLLQCEGNSLTPVRTKYEDFDYAKGEAMYEKIQVMDFFRQHNCEIIPTIYAHALPGGAVIREDFLRLTEELVDGIPESGIDGVWLYLHGALYVEEIGSGASGDNAFMLRHVQELGAEGVLIAGICDADATMKCYEANLGDVLTLTIGGSLDPKSESTEICGKLIHRGNILSYTGGDEGPSATLDCGKYTVVITKNRASMCRPDIFESINLDYTKFKTVIVKLGYLFPELARVAPRAILAFTPGSSCERLQDMI